jgi:DNA-binding response OmpR family regulator
VAKLLLVEDDETLVAKLQDWFAEEGHVLEVATSGKDGLQMLDCYKYEVVILDWQLPDISGPDICRQFRRAGGRSYVIFLTGKGSIENREQGLDCGGDDYMVKPFDVRELSARIRSVLRRPPELLATTLTIRGVTLKPDNRSAIVHGTEISLLPKELQLLEYLMRRPNRAFSAQSLMDAVWPSDSEAAVDTVRTWMLRLRKKLAAAGKDDFIKSMQGYGYIIEDDGD